MILTCPSCASRFMLSAQALAPEGRRVRCSGCREQWFQLPDPDELLANIEREMAEIPENVAPIPKGSALPVLAKEKREADPRRAALFGVLASVAVFALFLGLLVGVKSTMLKLWLPSAALYNTLGLTVEGYGEGLALDQFKAEVVGNVVRVHGDIINLKSFPQTVPLMEAVLKDGAGKSLAQWYIAPPKTALSSEEILPFSAEYKGDVKGAARVDVRFVLQSQ